MEGFNSGVKGLMQILANFVGILSAFTGACMVNRPGVQKLSKNRQEAQLSRHYKDEMKGLPY
jgi:hypothetical protein